MEYQQFSVTDFVADPFFNQWIKQPDEESTAFWSVWLRQNPQKMPQVEEARRIILVFGEQAPAFSQPELDQMWRTIEQRTQEPIQEQRSRHGWFGWRGVAAAITLLVLASSALYFYTLPTMISYQTGYGESKVVKLPDGSVVTLNANSTLRAQKEWKVNEPRQIWLDGEAYFQVTHTRNHQLFQVITDELTVAVRGTTFNVWQRGKKAKVMLKTGRVEVTSSQNSQTVVMQPGELVEVAKEHLTLERKKVNPALYVSWTDRKLIFQETPLEEIIDLLKNNYGLEVQVADPALLKKKITTQVTSENVALLLELLGESLNVEVQRQGNHILFK